MAGRPAKVTQAEIERAIRAIKAAGFQVSRIIARADGYAIEIASSLLPNTENPPPKPKPVL
jgi:hypothetical protein